MAGKGGELPISEDREYKRLQDTSAQVESIIARAAASGSTEADLQENVGEVLLSRFEA